MTAKRYDFNKSRFFIHKTEEKDGSKWKNCRTWRENVSYTLESPTLYQERRNFMDSIHVYQKIEPRILVQGEKANITTCRSLKQTNKQTF